MSWCRKGIDTSDKFHAVHPVQYHRAFAVRLWLDAYIKTFSPYLDVLLPASEHGCQIVILVIEHVLTLGRICYQVLYIDVVAVRIAILVTVYDYECILSLIVVFNAEILVVIYVRIIAFID